VEEMLRHFVSPMHDDWDEYLDCTDFAFNKSYSTSLKYSPWELVHPFQPLSPPQEEKGLMARGPATMLNYTPYLIIVFIHLNLVSQFEHNVEKYDSMA
jgi:hypothetical protein